MKKRFAFFDYDGTLAPGDSLLPFEQYAWKSGYIRLSELLVTIGAGLLWKAGLMKAESAKSISLRFLRHSTKSETELLCRNFWSKIMQPGFYRQGLEELRLLREQGYLIVLVSASPSVYMRYAPDYLPVDRVLSTKVDEQNGHIAGLNCKGEEKVRRIRTMLNQRGEELDSENSHAYGDSGTDAPMLRLCGHKHCVNAKSGLMEALKDAPDTRMESWQ